MSKLTCPYQTDHPLNVSLKKLVCFSFEFITLFRKKKFLVNLITKRNASIFAMFMEKENPSVFCFVFHLKELSFFPYECPGLCRHRNQSCSKWKTKKLRGFSFSINIAYFEAFLSVFKLTKNLFFLKSGAKYFLNWSAQYLVSI